jgi:chromosome segregation ATPase
LSAPPSTAALAALDNYQAELLEAKLKLRQLASEGTIKQAEIDELKLQLESSAYSKQSAFESYQTELNALKLCNVEQKESFGDLLASNERKMKVLMSENETLQLAIEKCERELAESKRAVSNLESDFENEKRVNALKINRLKEELADEQSLVQSKDEIIKKLKSEVMELTSR